MKQIALIFCILFLATSCEIQYDGETKMVVTGKLIDENGNSLPEKDIEITVEGGEYLLSPADDLISYGKSDQNGNFTFIFPAPKNGNRIYISINDIINQHNEFQSKTYIVTENNLENYKLDLKNITLYKNESITTLKLLLNQTSTKKHITDIKIEGKQPNSYIDLNPLQNNSDYLNTNYFVIKNQTIVLKYTTLDYSNTPTPTTNSISVPIANDAVTYTITY
jgi:hypothetical protein